MNEMMIFSNPEFGNVRTVMINGIPWFVGIDVARALGYAKPNDAVRTNTNKEDTSTAGVSDANNHITVKGKETFRLLLQGQGLIRA